MRVFVKGESTTGQWKELENIKEISIITKPGGQMDIFQGDSKTLVAKLGPRLKLNVETT